MKMSLLPIVHLKHKSALQCIRNRDVHNLWFVTVKGNALYNVELQLIG